MRVCLMIEGQEGVTWPQWLALARACERLGFDALFRSDHYATLGEGPPTDVLDAWTTIAALGAATTSLRMGTLVSPVTFRHPSVLAKSVVTADHVTGGRVELGMGAGWHEGEHRAYGFAFPDPRIRLHMLEEQVEIVHRLWDRDESEVGFAGAHYRLERCVALPKPVQDPHPNLILGGEAGRRSAAIAARWADEYNTTFVGPEECAGRRGRLDRACQAAGRDPSTLPLSLMTGLLIGVDEAEVRARSGRVMAREGESGDPAAYAAGVATEWLVGTPDRIVDRLAAYARAGVRRIMLQHLLHDDLDAVELLGAEVLPAAADL